jgi:hypothetical protein
MNRQPASPPRGLPTMLFAAAIGQLLLALPLTVTGMFRDSVSTLGTWGIEWTGTVFIVGNALPLGLALLAVTGVQFAAARHYRRRASAEFLLTGWQLMVLFAMYNAFINLGALTWTDGLPVVMGLILLGVTVILAGLHLATAIGLLLARRGRGAVDGTP